jgi:four helix bundle protein
LGKQKNSDTKSTFETLEVWKAARDLRKAISQIVRDLPNPERFRLSDQMLRASRSVTANIAEGHGRYHFQENIQFCRQARGSLYELLDHLIVALDEGYISEEIFYKLKNNIFNVIKVLNGYTKYLRNRKELTQPT